jgi:hypothetical protein
VPVCSSILLLASNTITALSTAVRVRVEQVESDALMLEACEGRGRRTKRHEGAIPPQIARQPDSLG